MSIRDRKQKRDCNIVPRDFEVEFWEQKNRSIPWFYKAGTSLTGVAQWIERGTVKQRVTGLTPSQGTCLGCGPGPQ